MGTCCAGGERVSGPSTMAHHDALHELVAQKDALIADLLAALKESLAWCDANLLTTDTSGLLARTQARAAIAAAEGK